MQRALAVASLHSPHSLAIGDDDKLVSLTGHDDSNPRRLRLFHSLTVHASLLMSMTQGHRHSASTSQNIKASLANAYQELGKELCSTKVKVIGNYTLGRVIGEGTYGTVRLGTHRLTSTRVAIKQIPKEMSAALTREIHHHRRLHHPHVTKLFEVIASESSIWLITELCSGGELFDYLAEKGRLSEDEGRVIFGQLCLAVGYIHEKGVVHRDLKLENVLLDEHCRVKLGDFGFTREFERGALLDTYCGTTGYAAPEMLLAKKYLGPEVDVWSLGIILHCLLTGTLPFDDDDESVMREKIILGDFEIPDWISEDARDLIHGILQHEPSRRLTISQILSHPWYTNSKPRSTSPAVPGEAVESASGSAQHLPSPSTSESSFHSASSELVEAVGADTTADSSVVLDDISFLTNSEGTIRQKKIKKIELADPTRRQRAHTVSAKKDGKAKKVTLSEDDVFLASSSDISRHDAPRSTDPSPSRARDASPGQSAPPSAYPVRTPARTKRRSMSSQLDQPSSPMTETQPKLQQLPPQDYANLLSKPAPLLFSTALERQLLNNLNAMGFDIGQMVHSVLSDACDASGAMWWMLKRKAEKKAIDSAMKESKSITREAETEAETEIDVSHNPSPGYPDSPAVEEIMRTIDQSQSAPELSLIPATPTIPTSASHNDRSHSPPMTPPRSKSPLRMLSPPPASDASMRSNQTTPTSKDKETNQGSKGRGSNKPRSGSVSIVQRATTAALEAAGLVRKKSNEAVKDKEKEDKEKERASSSIESKSGHPSGHARLTKSPPLKPVKDTPIPIPATPEKDRTAAATDLGGASPWIMPVARSFTFDVAPTPSNTPASGSGPNLNEGKQPVGMRNNRSSILHTFRTWFNEDRKGKRKTSHIGATSSTPPNMPAVPASPAHHRSGFKRGRGGYKQRTKRASVSSRRSSSVNSRRSSVTSMQMGLMENSLQGYDISRQRSDPSRRSYTPNSELDRDRDPLNSRPSSIRSYGMHVRHKKSTSFGSNGSTARMARAASPLNKAHYRAGSSSSTRAIRHARHSKGSVSTGRPRHVRSNSTTSSIQSSRPGSFYDASDNDGMRGGSPHSYFHRSPDETPKRSNSYKMRRAHGAASLNKSVSHLSWKKSWGQEPPGWQSRSAQFPVEVLAISPASEVQTAIRDVFAAGRPSINLGDESDWVDEDDDFPPFAGGLGQMGSANKSGPANAKHSFEHVPQMSPTTRNFRGGPGNRKRGRNRGSRSKTGQSPTGMNMNMPLPNNDTFDAPKEIPDSRLNRRNLPSGRSPAFRGPAKIVEEEEEEE